MTRFVGIEAAQQIVQYHGFHIKDAGLLGSAIARPRTSLFGEVAYPAFELKVAALMHSVIKNRSLVDGNKRTAWSLFYYFLYINDIGHTMNDDRGFDLVSGLSTDRYTIEKAAEIIARHIVPLKN